MHRDVAAAATLWCRLLILFMAAKQGPNVLFCMSNRTKRILLVSVMMKMLA
jgi:hypothetical protein